MSKVWINPAFKDKIPEMKKEEKAVTEEKKIEKPKSDKKKENGIVQITESVLDKLKEKGINTEKLTDLINKEFTKESLSDELMKRSIPDEQIGKILCRVKEKNKEKPPQSPKRPAAVQSIEHKLFKHFMDKGISIEARLVNGITLTGKIKWFSEWFIGFEVEAKPGTVVIPRIMIVYYKQLQESSLSESEIKNLPLPSLVDVEISEMGKYKDNKTPLLFHLTGNIDVKGILGWYEKLIYHIRSIDGTTEYNLHRGSIIYIEEVG